MHLDIVVWLRDMDAYGGIYRETWHLCKDILQDYSWYKTIARQCNKRETLSRVNQVPIRKMIRERQLNLQVVFA